MKVKELKSVFSDVIQKLNYTYSEPQKGNQTVSSFSKLVQLRIGFDELENTGLLLEELDEIRSSAIFTTSKDVATLNVSEGRSLRVELDNLIKLAQSLNRSFAKIGGETNEHSISIKLPVLTDFEDLSKISSDFHTILNQAIVNDEIDGQVQRLLLLP